MNNSRPLLFFRPNTSSRLMAVAMLLLGLTTGCSPRTNIRPVTGKILLDGQPLANASITLQPLISPEPQGATEGMGSYGRTNDQGEFSLRLVDTDEEGAVIGTHILRISIAPTTGEDHQLSSADHKLPLSVRDGSERLTVKEEGKNHVEFSLKSK